MTKQEKVEFAKELAEKFKQYPNFYITDTAGMTVSEMNAVRRVCFEKGIPVAMIKNTLIRKALEQLDGDYSEVYGALKQTSSVFFSTAENPSVPAKLLEELRKSGDKPVLKAACIETSVFLGDDQIKALTELKSKDELIGEIVGLLQSPPKRVISALSSGGQTIAGLIKTLSEREEN